MLRMLLAGTALAFAPAAASAATYDFSRDFGSSVFRYGYGTGANFTAFTFSANSGCFGVAALACRTPGGNSSLPYAGTTNDGSAFAVGTVSVPANTLLFHPGSDGSNSDAILQFVAPRAGTYMIDGTFLRVDTTDGAGNGVLLSAYVNGGFNSSLTLGNTPYGNSTPVSGSIALAAGDIIQLNVGNNGEYTYDTTGLQGSISVAGGVPEPASWAMMIGGFGLVGGTLRRRSTRVSFA